MGFQGLGPGSLGENRPTYQRGDLQQLIIVTKEVGVNGRRCTANLKCKSLLFIAGLATNKSANDLNFTKALARSYAGQPLNDFKAARLNQ